MGGTLLLVLTLLAPTGHDSVYGVVRDAITNSPIAGVRVEWGAGGPWALSNPGGSYALAPLPSGMKSLSFSRAGYDRFQLRVVVSAGSSVHVDVELQPVPQALPPLEVAGAIESSRHLTRLSLVNGEGLEVGLRRFRREALSSDPLVTTDDPLLAAATTTDPSAQAGLVGALHVHGGAGDQNLVVVDGLPLYATMHEGGTAGLVNPDAVAEVDVHSLPPASFGGRLSSAVEVQLAPASDRPVRMAGAWDPTALRQMVEGSFARGAGSILVSGRQSYRGVFAQDGDPWLSNGFHDLLARGSFTSGSDAFRVYLVNTADRLSFPALDILRQNTEVAAPGPRNRFSWSSSTAGAVWTHSRPDGLAFTARLWNASSGASIDWSPGLVHIGSALDEIGVGSELVVNGRSSVQRLGFSLQRTAATYLVTSTAAPGQLRSAPTILSAFVEDRRRVGPWSTSAGLRAASVNAGDLSFEPRLSLRYQLAPAVTASIGAARLHQYVQSMRNEESLLDHAFTAELPVTLGAGGLGPALSDQLTVGLETRIGARAVITVDGYARRFTGLLVPAAISSAPFAPSLPPVASGNAQGLELQARYHGNSLEAQANLGLAFTERDLGTSEFIPTSLRSRWATGGIVRRLGDQTSVRLAATVSDGGVTSVLGSGVEWQSPGGLGSSGEISGSPQEILGPLNGTSLPIFFRTDLGLTREWRVGRPNKDAGLTAAFTITNLFNRPNVLGYTQNGSVRHALLFPSRSLLLQLGWTF